MAAFDKPKGAAETSQPRSPFGAVLRSASQTNTAAASPMPTRPSTSVASAPATPASKPMGLANKFGSQSAGASPSGGSDEYEELDKRAVEAGKWVDREIRKLIAEIQR